ncbi:MAG: RES domain-containing protein [Hyphomicrobiaceae bacterium]
MRFRGAAYRAHNPRWSWSPLSGEGAKIHGGRFNPKGTAALYLALELSTAIIEFNQGLPLRLVPPITIVSYAVDCDDVVDLTDAAERDRLHVTHADMACAWKLLAETGQAVPSWILAERMQAGGAAGIVVPSYSPGAQPGTKNLVLWHWTDDLPHRVRIYDPDTTLPRNDASWRTK